MSSGLPPSALLLFAKAPEPGKTKTRLTPPLSRQEASRLQEAMILDLLEMTSALGVDRHLLASPDARHPFFQRISSELAIPCKDQEGENLGERMERASRCFFDEGFEKVVIIGTDAPTLPVRFIDDAFRGLDRSPVVVGPSLDGGYYLIGLRERLFFLFEGIAWGSERVLAQTLEKINSTGIGCHLLPFWYDIDRETDLSFAGRHLELLERRGEPLPARTFQFLRALRSSLTASSSGRSGGKE
jgi:rSAM/selenodomain-associated transferase 1